jgi:hypothetical protein
LILHKNTENSYYNGFFCFLGKSFFVFPHPHQWEKPSPQNSIESKAFDYAKLAETMQFFKVLILKFQTEMEI